ncbi:MAG: SHOCT domain-containing protein [Candidatus Cloacimonetes bacterium]|nr:SHOCT domain-containing protein [Candidatus Cloacimonadota bacterium]
MWWTHNNFFFRTAFTVALFILVLLILKELFKANIKGEKPIDILQGRYARGEIDKEEYERIKKDLEKEERAEDK